MVNIEDLDKKVKKLRRMMGDDFHRGDFSSRVVEPERWERHNKKREVVLSYKGQEVYRTDDSGKVTITKGPGLDKIDDLYEDRMRADARNSYEFWHGRS